MIFSFFINKINSHEQVVYDHAHTHTHHKRNNNNNKKKNFMINKKRKTTGAY